MWHDTTLQNRLILLSSELFDDATQDIHCSSTHCLTIPLTLFTVTPHSTSLYIKVFGYTRHDTLYEEARPKEIQDRSDKKGVHNNAKVGPKGLQTIFAPLRDLDENIGEDIGLAVKRKEVIRGVPSHPTRKNSTYFIFVHLYCVLSSLRLMLISIASR